MSYPRIEVSMSSEWEMFFEPPAEPNNDDEISESEVAEILSSESCSANTESTVSEPGCIFDSWEVLA